MPMRLASAIVSLLSQIFLVAMVRGQSAPERLPTLFEEPLSPRIANYQIDVSLDPANRTLRGKQVLTLVQPDRRDPHRAPVSSLSGCFS